MFSYYYYYLFISGNAHRSAIAVIRVSGDRTREALKALTGCDDFQPRYATLKKFVDPISNELIDKGLVLYFDGPKSFTGEDSCEFYIHGGPSVKTAMLSALSKVDGLRFAEPGEFSRRAFYNGKFDLTGAEAIADLIHAETEYQRKQALIQADGNLYRLYQKWRTQLIRNIAHFEAFIDFSEDENIEDFVLETVQKDLQMLVECIKNHLIDGRKGERLRNGVKMAILGATNVGKSSLMNVLCQRDVSIVTNVEGTTRDVIETHYDIGGFPIILADTAGLRQSKDIVEQEGIKRAKRCAIAADLKILVIDGHEMEKYFANSKIDFAQYLKSYKSQLELDNETFEEGKLLTIVNKCDLMSKQNVEELNKNNILTISCINSTKITEAVTEITRNLKDLCGNPSAEAPVLSQARHRHYLQECYEHINKFLNDFDPSIDQDLAILVQHLRNAIRSIGRITGEVRTDDVLDVIFKDFCIGK